MNTSIPYVKKALPPYLKDLRTEANLSLSEAAERAGVTKTHVWEMERGSVANPTINTLCRLAVAYGVNPSLIVGRAISDAMASLKIETKTERFVAK